MISKHAAPASAVLFAVWFQPRRSSFTARCPPATPALRRGARVRPAVPQKASPLSLLQLVLQLPLLLTASPDPSDLAKHPNVNPHSSVNFSMTFVQAGTGQTLCDPLINTNTIPQQTRLLVTVPPVLLRMPGPGQAKAGLTPSDQMGGWIRKWSDP